MAIPPTAKTWAQQLDPYDIRPLYLSVASMLNVADGEQIDPADWELIMSAEGTALGVSIMDEGAFAPALSEDGLMIGLRFEVAEASQTAPGFDAGANVPITIRFGTTATPPNRFERTAVVRVVNK